MTLVHVSAQHSALTDALVRNNVKHQCKLRASLLCKRDMDGQLTVWLGQAISDSEFKNTFSIE